MNRQDLDRLKDVMVTCGFPRSFLRDTMPLSHSHGLCTHTVHILTGEHKNTHEHKIKVSLKDIKSNESQGIHLIPCVVYGPIRVSSVFILHLANRVK